MQQIQTSEDSRAARLPASITLSTLFTACLSLACSGLYPAGVTANTGSKESHRRTAVFYGPAETLVISESAIKFGLQ